MARSRVLVFVLALFALSYAQVAHARRAVAVVAPFPLLDHAELRAFLERQGDRVQSCAIETGTRGARVQVNLYAFPDGSWSLTTGTPRGTPPPGQHGGDALARCVARAMAAQVGPRVRPFGGSRPRKISRRFALTPAPPAPRTPVDRAPTAAELTDLSRVLSARRRPLTACFPHTRGASSTAVALRVEVAPDGALRITGLRIPTHLDFPTVAQCVERALDGARGPATGDTLRGEVPLRTPIDPAPAADPTEAPASTP